MPPRVTAVIPCFNHGRFVGEAVRSVLAQQDAAAAAVIVNDGSSDGSTPAACDALASDRVAVIHQENRGLPAARNRGASHPLARGAEFLIFLDADDYLEPTFVRDLHRELAGANDPLASHAYCQERLIELGTGIWRVPPWDPLCLLITNLHPVTTLLRRDVFDELAGFDETMTRGYEDWEFWIRLSQRGYRGVRVREPLFVWRRHSHTTMVMEAVKRHDELFAQILQRHAETYRRRAFEIIAASNSMLRRFDCNWIDESGFPIPLQYLWSLRDQADATRREYEASAAVRLNRAVQRRIGALPRPAANLARRMVEKMRQAIMNRPA